MKNHIGTIVSMFTFTNKPHFILKEECGNVIKCYYLPESYPKILDIYLDGDIVDVTGYNTIDHELQSVACKVQKMHITNGWVN